MGGAANLLYFVRDAFRSLRENFATAAFTSVTLGFSLAIFALFIIIFANLHGVLGSLGDRTHVLVYLKSGVTGGEALGKELKRIPGVRKIKYVSKEDALKELKSGLKGGEKLFEGLDKNPLPASFEITLTEEYRDVGKMLTVVERLKALNWVDDIQYSQEWVRKFSAFLKFVELGAVVLGVFLAVATVFIITNTIRLTVYARRDEIEVLRLVGASDIFIRAPFFIEGVVQGAAGGVIALVILLLFRFLIAVRIPQYLSFVVDSPVNIPALLLILVVAGVFMGVVGSLVSMGRFLRV
jgi:cell division transport system permease protein